MNSTVDEASVSVDINKISCFREKCHGSKTRPYDADTRGYHDIVKFVYSASLIRSCLICSTVSFVCKVCGEHYPSNNANTYMDSVIKHMMTHFGVLGDVKHNYFYVDFVNQPDGDIDCDAIPTTRLGANIVSANYIVMLKYFPHIIFLSKTNYRKLFAEVAKKYDLRKHSDDYAGVSYRHIEEESQDYLIQLIQEGYGADGYECVFCGLEFDCMPSIDVCMLHMKLHDITIADT